MSLLVVGSVAFDSIKTPHGTAEDALGGSATYFSYSASFFSPVQLVAVVGQDFPEKSFKLLKDKGIALDGLEKADGKTFRWKGTYEGDMNAANTLATDLNVFESFDPKIPKNYADTAHVFLANIDPDLQLKVLDKMKSPTLIGCDTMNLWINIKKDSLLKLLKRVDLFVLNDGEARQLTGINNLIEAGQDLLKKGPTIVVIKKGEHGSILFTKSFIFVCPAFPADKVVDPTGAGDCFAGGFFGSLAASGGKHDEATLRRAVIFGTVMASFNIETFSLDRLTRLKQDEIVKRCLELEKVTQFNTSNLESAFRPAALTA